MGEKVTCRLIVLLFLPPPAVYKKVIKHNYNEASAVWNQKEAPIIWLIKYNDSNILLFCLAFFNIGDRYIVADCGGGTVDLTVHQIEQPQGTLKELYKASGTIVPKRWKQFPLLVASSNRLKVSLQAGRMGPSAWTWPSRPCCARSSARISSRVSRPSVRPPGWTSPSRLRPGSGRRPQAGPTPSTSRCPSLSSTTTRDTGVRVWRPPSGGASELNFLRFKG